MDEIEYEKLIVSNITVIAEIIDKKEGMFPIEGFTMRKLIPQLFEILKEISFDELHEILDKNKDDMIHGPKIKRLLTQQGKDGLRNLLSYISECGE